MKKINKINNLFVTQSAIIAALYVILTLFSAFFGLDKGIIQFRVSEILTVLPAVTPSAILGLFIGCLISNILSGAIVFDVVFGSLATLIGALGTYYLGRRIKWLSAVGPIIANTVAVPLILKYAYNLEGTVIFFSFTVFLGELVCSGILGTLLLYSLPKKLFIHKKNNLSKKGDA